MGNISEAVERCIELAVAYPFRSFDDITIQVADEYDTALIILRHWLFKTLN